MPSLVTIPPTAVRHGSGGRQVRPGTRVAQERVRHLRQVYSVVGDGSEVASALTELPALYPLLEEAVEPLQVAFGDEKRLQLEALESDEGRILRVVVQVPVGGQSAAEQMRGFKRNWWLKNCSRAEASLVFDYETADGV